MDDDKRAVHADLRRRVLVEAGHRCAIPSCRYIEVEVHHILPWQRCRKHEYENLIALCPNCHCRADRGEIDRKSLRLYKANLRFAHDRFSQFEMDTLFALSQAPDGRAIPWPKYLNLLLKRLLDAGYVQVQESGGGVSLGEIKLTPDLLLITVAGREFITSLALTEH